MLAELAGTVDAATLAANARRVYAAATPLAHLLLSSCRRCCDARTHDLAGQWRFMLVATGADRLVGARGHLAADRRPATAGEIGPYDEAPARARPDTVALGSLTRATP